jgi:hypothetical protein
VGDLDARRVVAEAAGDPLCLGDVILRHIALPFRRIFRK